MNVAPTPALPILRPRTLPGSTPRHDFHLHTDFTDGKPTISAYAERAVSLGLTAIGFPEHCNSRSTWLTPWCQALQAARAEWGGKVELRWGIEAKAVDFSGTLAAPAFMAEAAEYIYGAFHSSIIGNTKFPQLEQSEAVDMEYRATLGMIRAQSCHAIAHPGGLSEKYHGGFPLDLFDELAKAGASYDVALELNPGYSADISAHLKLCQRHDCGVVLGSNAHHLDQLGAVVRSLETLKNEMA